LSSAGRRGPDSLLRTRGAGAARAVLEGARPVGDVLFELLSEGIKDPGPEQRAALHARLVEAAGRIANRTLAAEYRRTLLDRFFETYRRKPAAGRAVRAGASDGAGSVARLRTELRLRAEPRRQPEPMGVRRERLRILTAILLRHPELLHDVEQAYRSLDLPEDLRVLREHMVGWAAHAHVAGAHPDDGGPTDAFMTQVDDNAPPPLDSQALIDHLTLGGLSAQIDKVLGGEPLPLAEQVEPGDMPAEVETRWWHFFGLLNFERLVHERDAAVRDWVERNDAPSERRMRALSEVCAALRGGEQADEDGWNG